MSRSLVRRIASLPLAGALTSVPAAAQQAADGPRTAPPASTAAVSTQEKAPDIPLTQADLDRIKKSLANEPILRLDETRLRFYIQILAKQPQWSEWVKGY